MANPKGSKTFLEPIRDLEDIRAMGEALKEEDTQSGQYAYVIWCIGIYTGLRIEDILTLKINNICGRGKIVRERFRIREKKTDKEQLRKINAELRPVLQEYIDGLQWGRAGDTAGVKGESFLFPSPRIKGKHIGYAWFRNRLTDAAAAAGIRQRVATHTMRKTFAYRWWITNRDNRAEYPTRADAKAMLSRDLLKHEKVPYTERYICIDQEEIDRATDTVSYGGI